METITRTEFERERIERPVCAHAQCENTVHWVAKDVSRNRIERWRCGGKCLQDIMPLVTQGYYRLCRVVDE